MDFTQLIAERCVYSISSASYRQILDSIIASFSAREYHIVRGDLKLNFIHFGHINSILGLVSPPDRDGRSLSL